MNSNLLTTRIKGIQIEYKELLSKLSPKLKSGQVPEALDELNLFWLRHIDEVQLYLKYWLYGEDCYIFTAATFMDFNDNEHLPFLLMGEKHILDDPLGRYSELCRKMERGTDSEFLYRQVIITSEDNLSILEGTDENILILPLQSARSLWWAAATSMATPDHASRISAAPKPSRKRRHRNTSTK